MIGYIKGLTMRQWLVTFCIIVFFIASYFIFFRKPVKIQTTESQTSIDLKTLMRQGAAPSRVEDNLTRSEVETLLKQGTVDNVPGASGVLNENLTKQQKDDILKLMSVPR